MPLKLEIEVARPGLGSDELGELGVALGGQLLELEVMGTMGTSEFDSTVLTMTVAGPWVVDFVVSAMDQWQANAPGRAVELSIEGQRVDHLALRSEQQQSDAADFPLRAALSDFVSAESAAESRQVLDAHPELMSARGDKLLGDIAEAAMRGGDRPAARIFSDHQQLLRRCSEIGVDAAFAELGDT